MTYLWIHIKPTNSMCSGWVLTASLPGQQLTEAYTDYREMMERIYELLKRYKDGLIGG